LSGSSVRLHGPASPYKGLGYYAERDAPYFFGREDETSIVAANLIAARLTLVYGASGVGKSSLLRAGVARRLRDQAQEAARLSGSPGAVVVVFPADDVGGARRNSWRDDPLVELAAGIGTAVAELGIDVDPVDSSLSFAEFLEGWNERLDADVLLILDQFEEYFLYHGQERDPGTFSYELSRALTRPDTALNVLLSIREDAYSKLDSFKGRIPFLYDNYLRIDHLDRAAARAAVERPIEQYNRLVAAPGGGISLEAELVDAVLDDVQTGQLALGQSAAGTAVAADGGDSRIETPFLQLVLERLWDEELRSGSRTLRLSTLERLGGAERIVRTHLDAAMASLANDEKELAARAFRQLVTPSGTKIAHLPSDLAALEDAPPDELAVVLDELAANRILRPIAPPPGQTEPRYEIFHDVLAPAILDWRGRFLHERTQRERDRRRRRRLTIVGTILSAVLLAALGAVAIAFFTLNDRTKDAEDAAFVNEARAAEGFAGVFVAGDPVMDAVFSPDGRHVLTAGEGGDLKIWSTGGAAGATGGKLLRTLHEDSGVHTARYDRSGRFVVATTDDGVGVWSLGSGKRTQVAETAAADAAFSPTGDFLAIGGLDGVTSLVTWPGLRTTGKLFVREQSAVRSVDISSDGRLVATASDDGEARVWQVGVDQEPRTYRASDQGTAYTAAFSSSGNFLVTGAQDGSARVWEVPSARQLTVIRTGRDSVLDASFSTDEKFIVAAYGTLARVWVWSRPQPALQFEGNADTVTSATFNDAGSLVLTAGSDGTARLWSVALPDLTVELVTVEMEPDGRSIRTTFNVTNTGGSSAGATRVRLSSPGFEPVTVAVPPLRPGGVYPVEADLRIPPSARGARPSTIRVSVNPQRRAIETEYSNNTEARPISIAPPDLALETKAVVPDRAGRSIVLVEIRNVGKGTAEATTVVSHPRGYAPTTVPIPPLRPGRRMRLEVPLQANPGAPAQQATVTVDPNGVSGDQNPQNNRDSTEPLPAFAG